MITKHILGVVGVAAFTGAAAAATTSTSVATSSGTFKRLVSPSGAYSLVMQPDGNLVEFNYLKPIWSSNTAKVGSGPYNAVLQNDGNVVIYQQNGQSGQTTLATWSTGTYQKGTAPFQLAVKDDGNVVLSDATGVVTWTSGKANPTADVKPVTWEAAVASSGTFTSLVSPNGTFSLKMGSDGNLNLYGANAAVLWSSQTKGLGVLPYRATMQPDGNLVIYDKNSKPLWSSGTYLKGTPPFTLSVNNYGNAKIYDGTQLLTWSAIGTAGTSLVGSAWSPAPKAPYNAQLSYWPNPSYLDAQTIAKQEAAWNQVSAALVAAAASGADSYTIPPGIYRSSAQTALKNVKQKFTIYAAGAEIIAENLHTPVLYFESDDNVTLNGPMVLDSSTPAWTQAVITSTDNKGSITFKLDPGYPTFESYGQFYLDLQFFDKNGVRLPMDGEYPVGMPGNPPQDNFANLISNGGGSYTLNKVPSDLFTNKVIGIGTHVIANGVTNAAILSGYNNNTINFNHVKLYGASCCQYYMPYVRNVFRDFKSAIRPGTNRLAGYVPAYNFSGVGGSTFVFDEVEIGSETDDLMDLKSNSLYTDYLSPQQGLPSNQLFMTQPGGLSFYNLSVGWVLNFRDPTTLAVYASGKITAATATDHKNSDGSQEVLVTLDKAVTILPNSPVDSTQSKMAVGTVVDSYFHDGDNNGIQIKGAVTVNVTNNYVERVIASSIYLGKDYEGAFNDQMTVSNNSIVHGYYAPSQYYQFPSINVTAFNNMGGTGTSGFLSTTINANSITKSAFGIKVIGSQKNAQSGNVFTADPAGWQQGWQQP